MNVFWQTKPLAAQQAKLLTLVFSAHAKSADRDNISTNVLKNVAIGSGDYLKSLSAALCSLGAAHAPLMQTYAFLKTLEANLDSAIEGMAQYVELGGKVPGWGSSFEKDGVDPLWQPVANHLADQFPDIMERIQRVTDELHARGKMIYANPSVFTAATAIIVGLPPQIAAWIFIQGRLSSWSSIYYNTLAEHNAPRQHEANEALV